MKRALIVTAENFHGIARLPRLLAAAGCRVASLAPPRSNLADSGFVTERLVGSSDPGEALERLRCRREAAPGEWVVFGDDIILERAVARRAEPWLAPLFPLKDASFAELLISKSAFSAAMGAAGVRMAPARSAAGPEGLRAAARELGYPLIAKPDAGSSGLGLIAARGPAELEASLGRASGAYIVERLIEGRMGATPALFDAGKPVWWSSFRNEGVFPAPYGPSCRRLSFEPPGIGAVLERMGMALGLHGLVGVDWMLTPGGELYVIELNGRPIQMDVSARHVEEQLPAALRDFLAGRPGLRPPPVEQAAGVLNAMPASFQLSVSEGRYAQAAGLLLGLGGRTDTPWSDAGLLKNHVGRLAKTLVRMSLMGAYGRLPVSLQRAVDPVTSRFLKLWRARGA